MKKEIILKGRVISGTGKGRFFVNLFWARKQFQEKLGFNPYPGTLNLQLPPKSGLDELKKASGIVIVPEKGYKEGKCFRALIMEKVWGAVIVLNFPEYPSNLLEVIAPVNLRETLGLYDCMEIEVAVQLD